MLPQAHPASASPPPTPPPPLPQGLGWIDLIQASQRSGKSRGHWARLCATWFLGSGMARQVRGADGRRHWEVREDADPSLARVKSPAQIGADLRRFTERQRAVARQRLQIIQEWEAARAAGITLGQSEAKITAHFRDRLLIERGLRIGRTTVFRWQQAWRREGLIGLIDGRGQRAAAPPADDPFLAEVRRLYLLPRRLTVARCHEIALLQAQECGWEPRSYKAAQRMVARIDQATIAKLRLGREAHTNQAAPFLEGDYTTLESNEIWCGDHHRFDVVVRIGQRLNPRSGESEPVHDRPWITAWMDERSRRIVGYQIFAHDPNTDTILEAFRLGASEFGVPQSVRVDNGRDYDSFALHGRTKKQRRAGLDAHARGVFAELGIQVRHVEPYHGQSKVIERFFGTLEDQFCRGFATHFGSNPQQRPCDYQANLDAGKAPTLEEFSAAFAQWLAAYHTRAHGGQGMDGRNPEQVWTQHLATKRTASPQALELLLLKPTAPVKIGQNGVICNGLRYGQYEPELYSRIGQEVVLRVDSHDVSQVSVWDLDGRFICVAQANQRVPKNASAQVLRQALVQKRRLTRIASDYHEARPRLHEDLPDLMIRAAAAQAADTGDAGGDPDLPPPSLRPIQTPLTDQLPALQRALERPGIAVGAESLDLSQVRAAVRGAGTESSAAPDPFATLSSALRLSTQEGEHE